MIKEIIATILLLLVFAGALINISCNDKMVYSLEDEVKAAMESAIDGDFDNAKSQLDTAAEHWLSLDGYTHIFIRHSEIDSVTDAFFNLKSTIYEEEAGACEGAYGQLMAHLESIRTMEHIRFGSIF
ncbi:MAG: DUF4363 family protein [Bacillota bacterium]|nr:DUF4363 family protein [Bacillota bacterium]